MGIIILTLILSILGMVFCLHFISPRPEFMPLLTNPDDPLLKAAMDNAKNTLADFIDLFDKYPHNASIKLKFISNTDQTEYLWAEVKAKHDEESFAVILVTPPVTHRGHLDRNIICRNSDIVDWVISDNSKRIYGGFTERAMFDIARMKNIPLSKKLRERQSMYKSL